MTAAETVDRLTRILELGAQATEAEAFRTGAALLFDYLKEQFSLREGGYVLVLLDEELEERFFHSDDLNCPLEGALPMLLGESVKRVLATGTYLIDNEFVTSGAGRLPAGHLPLENMLFVPLCSEGTPGGVVAFANKPGGFDEEDGRLTMAFSQLAGALMTKWRAKRDLERRVEWFRQASVGVTDAIVTMDRKLRIRFWNPAAEELFGWTQREVRGEAFTDILAPASREDCMRRLDDMWKDLEEGNSEPFEAVTLDREGLERSIELTLSPWEVHGRHWITAVLRDIEHRKRAELAVLVRHQELSAVFDHAPTPMMLLDGKRRLRRVNRAGLRFGDDIQQAVGRLAGDAMRCVFALSQEGGCGVHPSCGQCGLKRLVESCYTEGSRHERIPIDLHLSVESGEAPSSQRIFVTTVPFEGDDERMVLVYLEEAALVAPV